ncbi:guanine nucleotide-binding protein G(I)/G(S)/G(O) subunit gamma-5 isoform X2 [Salvelinus sp. IW2-2015]|uniref:guanine nucleotide-binding protein G(I)/G(S)/G(O) subunit gamma-5 isoform X2 n=1 Tax=Salvelinus sp. IW2-2015 TaxID=2691554 RepID=UPI000CEA8B5C|nr:guanine nucleotide-binding protein G(I)/G(S)/G(O) subunit gamma-5-like isoform X2 [Salvelinus alpinus]
MSNNNASSNLVVAQRVVKQLRLEASVRRIKVSQAAVELKNYCLQNAHQDPLLMGYPPVTTPSDPQVLQPVLSSQCMEEELLLYVL